MGPANPQYRPRSGLLTDTAPRLDRPVELPGVLRGSVRDWLTSVALKAILAAESALTWAVLPEPSRHAVAFVSEVLALAAVEELYNGIEDLRRRVRHKGLPAPVAHGARVNWPVLVLRVGALQAYLVVTLVRHDDGAWWLLVPGFVTVGGNLWRRFVGRRAGMP